MTQAIQKVCRVCGIDVANQKRTKDTLGNYYCHPCYSKSRTPEPKADDLFTCPSCNGSFDRAGMDESGICHNCNAVKPTTSATCGSCGASIGNQAVFCSRCGAQRDGRLSTDDEIEVTSIIANLRRYAELNAALIQAADSERQYHGVRPQMIAAGAVRELAELDQSFSKAQAVKKTYIAECEDLKKRLHRFDQNRVAKVRGLILDNASVDEAIKAGVRLDLFGVFGPPSTPYNLPPQVSKPSEAHRPLPKKKPEFMNGIWSGPSKRATKKTISSKPLIVGFLCLIAAATLGLSASNDSPLFPISVLLSLGGVATMLAWGVIAIVRKLSGRGNESSTAVVEPISTTPEVEMGRPFPVGLCIAVGTALIGVILLILAVTRFFTATSPSPDDIDFVVVSFLVGVVLMVIGFATWSKACPKCLLLYTSEILGSEQLGTHIETRKESRVARHYDAKGGPAQSETHYEVAIPISVTTSRHTKHCKACGHIWQTTSRTES
jgi:hypothetical protein